MDRDFNVGDNVVFKYDPEGMKGQIIAIFWEDIEDAPIKIVVKWENGTFEDCEPNELIVV